MTQPAPSAAKERTRREGATLGRGITSLELAEAERWFLVHTLPSRESGAAAQLEQQGFRSFVPRIRKTIRHARQLRTVLAPLFPRYLFVILDPDRDCWRSVNGTFGVARLCMSGSRPEPVPHGLVETFVAIRDEGGIVRLDGALREGQPVRVLSGPFASLCGTLERMDDNGRVRVLLSIMGSAVPVDVHRSALQPA